MPDQTLRYRVEIDSAGLLAQLQGVEAQAGGQLATMVRPIEQATFDIYQRGMQGIMQAHSIVARTQMSIPATDRFQAQGLATALDRHPSFADMVDAATFSGSLFRQDYRYTPREQQFLYAQELGRRVEDTMLASGRGGLTAAADFYGGFLGARAGFGLGAGLAGGVPGLPGMAARIGLGGVGGVAGFLAADALGVGDSLYGPLGGAQVGALAGSLFSPAGSAAGAVLGGIAGTGFQLGAEAFAARNIFRPLVDQIGGIASTFPFSGSPLGTGYSPAQTSRITGDILRQAAGDPRFGLEDYGQIIQAGAQMGRFDSARTVEQFSATLKDLVESVKMVNSGLRQTLDESLQSLRDISSLGFRKPDDVRQFVNRVRASAQVSGLEPGELLQAAEMGEGLTRGFSLQTGGMRGMQGLVGAHFLRQTGAILDPRGVNVTSEVIKNVGGELPVAEGAARALTDFFRSGEGRTFLMAAYDPSKRGINQSVLESFAAGGMDRADIATRAALTGMNVDSRLRFMQDAPFLERDIPTSLQAEVFLRNIRNQARALNTGDEEAAMQSIAQSRLGRLGMPPLQARATFEAIRGIRDTEAMLQQAEDASAREPLTDDWAREQGISGRFRRLQVGLRQGMVNAGLAITENLYDPIRNNVASNYNRYILGTTDPVPPSMLAPGTDAIQLFGRGGSPGLPDMRSGVRDTGMLNFLFGPVGPPNTAELLQKAMGSAGGVTPGFGSVVNVSQFEAERMRQSGMGIPIRNAGMLGTSVDVFAGSMSDLQSGLAENRRLAELVGTGSGARMSDMLVDGESRKYYDNVQQAIRTMGEDAFGGIVKGDFANGAARPTYTSLVATTGRALGFTEAQMRDPALREELARQASQHLTSEQIETMHADSRVLGGNLTTLELQKKRGESRDHINKVLDGVARFEDDEVGFTAMSGAAADTIIARRAHGDVTKDEMRDSILGSSGKGRFDSSGNWRWNSGVSDAEKERTLNAADRFATHADAVATSESQWFGSEAVEEVARLKDAPRLAQMAQQEAALDALSSTFNRHRKSGKEADAVYQRIDAMAQPGRAPELFEYLSVLDEEKRLRGQLAAQGIVGELQDQHVKAAGIALQEDQQLRGVVDVEQRIQDLRTGGAKGKDFYRGTYQALSGAHGKDGRALYTKEQALEMTKALQARAGQGENTAEDIRAAVFGSVGTQRAGGPKGVDGGGESDALQALKEMYDKQTKLLTELTTRVEALSK